MLLNSLLVLVAPNFRNLIEEMSKEKLNVFLKSFCAFAKNKHDKDGTLSVYKSSSMKSTWGPPYRFLRLLPLNKPFFTISDPAFTEANKALEHAFTTDKETVRQRWARKGREQKSRKTTKDDLVLPQSLFWPTRSWVFWADEDSKLYQLRKTIRVSEILKMNPIPRYFLPLTMKLVSKGKGERAWK